MGNEQILELLLTESQKTSEFLESDDFKNINDNDIKNSHKRYHYHIYGALIEIKLLLGIKEPEPEIIFTEP